MSSRPEPLYALPALPGQVAFRRFREAKKRRLLRALRMKREAERQIVEFAPLKPSLFEFGSAMLTCSAGAQPIHRPNIPPPPSGLAARVAQPLSLPPERICHDAQHRKRICADP